jgi:hypothetical protein
MLCVCLDRLHETVIHPPPPPPDSNRGPSTTTPRTSGKAKRVASTGPGTPAPAPSSAGRHTSKEVEVKQRTLGKKKKTRVRARQMHVEERSGISYGYSPSYSAVVDDSRSNYSSHSAPPDLSQQHQHQHDLDLYTSPAYLAYASTSPSTAQYGMPAHGISAPVRDRFTSPVPSASRPPRHPGHDFPPPPRPQSAPHSGMRQRSPVTTTASPHRPTSAHATPVRGTRSTTSTPGSGTGTGAGRSASTGKGNRRTVARSSPAGSLTVKRQKEAAPSPGVTRAAGSRGNFGKTTW